MSEADAHVRRFLASVDQAVEQLVGGLQESSTPPDPPATQEMRRLLGAVVELVEQIRRTSGETAPSAAGDVAVVIASPLGVPHGVEAPTIGRLLVQRRATRPEDVTLAVLQQGEGDDRPLGEILVGHGAASAAQVVDALEQQAEAKRSAAGTTRRVETSVLDSVADRIAELGETRDELVSRLGDVDDATLARAVQRLDSLVADLQADVRKMMPT